MKITRFNFLLIMIFCLNLVFIGCKNEVDSCANMDELLSEVNPLIETLNTEEFIKSYLDSEKDYVLIDVRQKKEFDNGSISGSVNISRGILEFKINDEVFWEEEFMYAPSDTTEIVIYCKKGARGALAAMSLMELGYKNVKNLEGGYKAFESKQPEAEEE